MKSLFGFFFVELEKGKKRTEVKIFEKVFSLNFESHRWNQRIKKKTN